MGDLVTYPVLLTLGMRAEADLAAEARAHRDHDVATARANAEELNGAHNIRGSLQFYAFEEPVGDEQAPPETETQWLVGEAELARLNANRGPISGTRSRRAGKRCASRTRPPTHDFARPTRAWRPAAPARTPRSPAGRAFLVRATRRRPLRDEIEALPAAPACRSAPSVPVKRAERPFGLTERELRCSAPWPSAARTGRSPRSSN